MTLDWSTILAAVIPSALSFLTAGYLLRQEKRKLAAQTESEAASAEKVKAEALQIRKGVEQTLWKNALSEVQRLSEDVSHRDSIIDEQDRVIVAIQEASGMTPEEIRDLWRQVRDKIENGNGDTPPDSGIDALIPSK